MYVYLSGVFGGLDLHGVQSTVSWTRLAASATSGTTSLVLSEPVDWSAGDELVVAPTGFSAWQTETVTIATVAADKVTITLTEALKYDHIGKSIMLIVAASQYIASMSSYRRASHPLSDHDSNQEQEVDFSSG